MLAAIDDVVERVGACEEVAASAYAFATCRGADACCRAGWIWRADVQQGACRRERENDQQQPRENEDARHGKPRPAPRTALRAECICRVAGMQGRRFMHA